ncbi:MAG: hypothetical protein WCD68_16595, partial [Candidatus Acidiferrum sp.]
MNHEWIAHSVRTLASAVILFVGVTPLARAQEKGTAPPLRLEQVVRLALQQNPAFQTSADEAEA